MNHTIQLVEMSEHTVLKTWETCLLQNGYRTEGAQCYSRRWLIRKVLSSEQKHIKVQSIRWHWPRRKSKKKERNRKTIRDRQGIEKLSREQAWGLTWYCCLDRVNGARLLRQSICPVAWFKLQRQSRLPFLLTSLWQVSESTLASVQIHAVCAGFSLYDGMRACYD